MSLSPQTFLGLELNERLRLVEILEERPFSLLFKGEVLALKRVVGTCSVLLALEVRRGTSLFAGLLVVTTRSMQSET